MHAIMGPRQRQYIYDRAQIEILPYKHNNCSDKAPPVHVASYFRRRCGGFLKQLLCACTSVLVLSHLGGTTYALTPRVHPIKVHRLKPGAVMRLVDIPIIMSTREAKSNGSGPTHVTHSCYQLEEMFHRHSKL